MNTRNKFAVATSAVGWVAATLVVGAMLAAAVATAQANDPRPPCAKHDVVVAALKQLGQELVSTRPFPEGMGEIFATPSGSTWSGAFVRPDGWTCLVVHGRNLDITEPERPELQNIRPFRIPY